VALYAGIDLHSNNNVAVVQDDEDNVVGRRRLPNDLATVCAWLEPYRKDLAGVVVESTYNWYWLVDALQEAGYHNTPVAKPHHRRPNGRLGGSKIGDNQTINFCCLVRFLEILDPSWNSASA
jgi:hypothetical protein